MEVIKNQIDDLNIELTIALKAEDYAEQEKKRLAAYRRNADFKGFRKGMVPAQLVKKIYGDQVLYEAINGIVSEQLDKFIKDNDLNILGEPIASESQKENEWKDGSDFEFKFDIGLSPKIEMELSKEDKVPCYKINVTEAAKAEMKENLFRQYGQLEEGEAAGEDDYVVVDFVQGDKSVEGAYVSVNKVEGTAKKKFLGAKVGDKFDVDVTKAFTNETDRASMLKMKKEELAALPPKWKVTVVNVKTFVPASENQDTYDKIFGKDVVKTPEEFDAKIAERLEANYKQESDYRLSKDLRKYLVDKAGVQVPENFLKRWLYESNKEKFSKEDVDKEFDAFLGDFRWQLVRGYLMKKLGLKIEDKDMVDAAKAYASYQYAMYGMGNVPEQFITDAAMNLLKDERQIRNIEESVENEKVVAAVKDLVTLQSKRISEAKFRELN
ncbi:MAG: trigger factor [Bacteroidales bacterium]|nr:trigger factor [Bacteroidales bacterium]